MRKFLWTLLTAGAFASGLAVAACGDDDNATGGTPDGSVVTPDGSVTPPPDGSTSPDGGGDAGCTFAGFVLNLINTQTTSSSLPSTDLGDQCTPSTSQADFASAFTP